MSRKIANSKSYFTFPANLFAAINTTCSGNEAKVLLTLLGCKCDRPNTQYMLDMTGIAQSNHYFAIRRQRIYYNQ